MVLRLVVDAGALDERIEVVRHDDLSRTHLEQLQVLFDHQHLADHGRPRRSAPRQVPGHPWRHDARGLSTSHQGIPTRTTWASSVGRGIMRLR